ncbi:MAG: SCO1664 family protein, partial [Anaerolineales bacterium]
SWLGEIFQVVYKPMRGERPLWDFPPRSLSKREVAAFIVSQALGWDLVPPTVFRKNAPYGAGMVQLYVEHNPNYHYFTFNEQDRQRLKPVAFFDLLVNNADRKGSHILVDPNGDIRCIDHGICFHVENKLRTVIWDFAGQPIPSQFVQDLEKFTNELKNSQTLALELGNYLAPPEIKALAERAEGLLNNPVFPYPPQDRRPYPWPLI